MESFIPANYPNFVDEGEAPCSETYPDMFFADDQKDGTMVYRQVYSYENEAKQVCANCPYRVACLTYAMENPDLQGIWGGLTEKDRNAVRRGTRDARITYKNRTR
jgi:WhiB family redox-sensing transcriptional regulator